MNLNSLVIKPVLDPGKPNLERIPIFVQEGTDMQFFWVGLGLQVEKGRLLPLRDNLFWFGQGKTNTGDWIFLHTGPGEPKSKPIPNGDNLIFSLHWGKKEVVFDNPDVRPFIMNSEISFLDQSLPYAEAIERFGRQPEQNQ